MLFISKRIKLSVFSFLLERKYTSRLIHVIYFKKDQSACLFFPIGKGINKHIKSHYLFQNGSNCLFIPFYWKERTQAYLFMLFISKWIMLSVYSFLLKRKCTSILIHVFYIKIDQNVCLFFHNWKGSTCVYLFMLFNSKWIKMSVYSY